MMLHGRHYYYLMPRDSAKGLVEARPDDNNDDDDDDEDDSIVLSALARKQG